MFVNVIFLLAGILLVVFGIVWIAAPEKVLWLALQLGINLISLARMFGEFFPDIIAACIITLIVLGVIVTIIAFLGFFGACCKSRCMTLIYAISIMMIGLAEIALIILVAVYPEQLKTYSLQFATSTLRNEFKSDVSFENDGFNTNSSNPVEAAWMTTQLKLGCCGSVGYSDYGSFNWTRFTCTPTRSLLSLVNNIFYNNTCPSRPDRSIVPISCCKIKGDKSGRVPYSIDGFSNLTSCLEEAETASTNRNGCSTIVIDKLMSFIREYSKILIGVAVGILATEGILVTFALMLYSEMS